MLIYIKTDTKYEIVAAILQYINQNSINHLFFYKKMTQMLCF